MPVHLLVIGYEDHVRNDLSCVVCEVKPVVFSWASVESNRSTGASQGFPEVPLKYKYNGLNR